MDFARSVLLDGGGPAISIGGEPQAKRTIRAFRSTIAATGAIVELSGSAGASGAVPATFHAFETTFGRVEAEGISPSPMIALREIPASPAARTTPLVDWLGDRNRFAGISQWTSASPEGLLAGLKAKSPNSDGQSQEIPAALKLANPSPTAPIGLDPAMMPSRVAVPSPYLAAKTLGSFGRSPQNPWSASSDPALVLNFDADSDEYRGDLGRFVMEKLKGSAKRVRVLARGGGEKPMTPLVLPEGISLEILVPPVPPGGRALVWYPAEDSTGLGLIAVKRADLALTGVRLAYDTRARVDSLVVVDQGDVALQGSWLTAPGQVETGRGRLLTYRTEGSRPFPSANSDRSRGGGRPSCSLKDCYLATGGTAIRVETGRALIALENCAMATGAEAFSLKPMNVRRDRFDCELRITGCTIASENTIVSVGPWTGFPPGPDRPWLVSSRRSVFLDAFDHGGGPGLTVLLRTDPLGLPRGVLLWESDDDVYALTHFTAGGDAPPPPVSRADIRREWIGFWGPSHIRNASGPRPGGEGPAARLLVDRLVPGQVEPGDLALDPAYPATRSGPPAGADLGPIGIKPTVEKFRPKRPR